MIVEFYTSAFCGPCRSTRAVLARAAHLVPAARVEEIDVADATDRAEAAGVLSTPTVLVRDDAGVEVFRAAGSPSLPQVLVALARVGPPVGPPVSAPG